ncbi:hypothetical protein Baya_16333 [Bagarius yarrelli]|uniref:Uncharacterized protein n=1 Tax=Bagarius yarrelli TaxID=175774 RepID=A0A556VV06_BAGYA|nr:hypothetical protein Baya_16333 [Bagarius yarrelli]
MSDIKCEAPLDTAVSLRHPRCASRMCCPEPSVFQHFPLTVPSSGAPQGADFKRLALKDARKACSDSSLSQRKGPSRTSAPSWPDGDADRGTTGMQDWHLQDSFKHLARRREKTGHHVMSLSSGKQLQYISRLD